MRRFVGLNTRKNPTPTVRGSSGGTPSTILGFGGFGVRNHTTSDSFEEQNLGALGLRWPQKAEPYNRQHGN